MWKSQGSGLRGSRASYWMGVAGPLLVTLTILAVDGLAGPRPQYIGLLAAVPMLAAVFVGPRLTGFVGVVTFCAALVFDTFFAPDATLVGEIVRLLGIALFTLVAVAAAAVRERSDRDLADARQVAQTVSLAVLRPIPAHVGRVPAACSYTSAHRAANVGGDLYEAASTPHGVRFVVGDVRGKGLEAVHLASVALGSFREAAFDEPDLSVVASRMSTSVARNGGDEDFVTGVLVELCADGSATFVSCGHPPPVLLRDGVASELPLPDGVPWGLPGTCAAVSVPLRPGDRVLLHTDGITEARSKEDRLVFFPLLEEATAALNAPTLEGALCDLTSSLERFTGGRLEDDAALLVFEVPPLR